MTSGEKYRRRAAAVPSGRGVIGLERTQEASDCGKHRSRLCKPMQILIAHVPLSMPRTCPHGACSSAATLPWNMRERCELLHSRTICLRLLVYYVQATQSSSDGQFDPGETWQTEHEMSLLSDNQMSLSLQAPEVPRSLVGFCDAPRISAAKYRHPSQQHAKLVHVIHVQRHHKRTPDNLVPESEASFSPPEGWQCVSDE